MKAWIDVGGTFTDCFVVDSTGQLLRRKVLSSGTFKACVASGSTAELLRIANCDQTVNGFWNGATVAFIDPHGEEMARRTIIDSCASPTSLRLDRPLADLPPIGSQLEIVAGIEAPVLAVRLALGIPLRQSLPKIEVRLGTTRGTNALLTRRGAHVGLIVTRGFADLLRIGSQERPDLFTLAPRKPAPLTNTVAEVSERLTADGSTLQPLCEKDVSRALQQLRNAGATSLAVCLLHAYRNDVHEKSIESIAKEFGFTDISLSSQVAPLIKLLSRAETTTLDAYLNPILANYITTVWTQFGGPDNANLRLMTSGGQLVSGNDFRGRDSVLSGPAGGVVALASIGDAADQSLGNKQGVIGFDMGGTSTDVSRYQGRIVRQFEGRKAGVRVMTPMMAIHTVAAGGGSICHTEDGRLLVGPDSAGSDPGPACYGRGGPLAVTDLNVILGRVDTNRFPFALDRQAIEGRLDEVLEKLAGRGIRFASQEHLAEGFWQIAIHHMAEAARTVSAAEGADPRGMALVSFGGAAGQHALAVAESLEMDVVIDHPDSSMLSALGMGLAPIGRSAVHGVYQLLAKIDERELENSIQNLKQQTLDQLSADLNNTDIPLSRVTVEIRYAGTESTIQLDLAPFSSLATRFEARHQSLYGYVREGRPIELVTFRVETWLQSADKLNFHLPEQHQNPSASQITRYFRNGAWIEANLFDREKLRAGDRIEGPALIVSQHGTLVVEPNWHASVCNEGTLVARRHERPPTLQSDSDGQASNYDSNGLDADVVTLEIVARRLEGIAEQMGEVLRRTAVSVNVKERLDYSCAVFRKDGTLVAGAMHVPVHLGAMGHTVRSVLAQYPAMAEGDCYVSNNPYAGGSHLPDVTVVTPVFVDSREGQPDFLVASRAHHAEIGGLTPGSMPPGATRLGEEGVILHNFALQRLGESHENELEMLLSTGPYPSRSPQENMADILAQVAAGCRGVEDVKELARTHGVLKLDHWMGQLLEMAAGSIDDLIKHLGGKHHRFRDRLIDDSWIEVCLFAENDRIVIDFTGTSATHPRGWNATPAIVSAAVLYVLRCLIDRPLPLSEGVLRRLDLRIPPGLLNPVPAERLEDSPAVVAGNVETSQRIVDCLLGALGVAAASQGTMNNLLIGDRTFGYYETICGGAGATESAAGEDAIHTHMTNTRITDPEVLEARYPLRLWQFSIRRGSGGAGNLRGGDGVIREIEALRPLTVSLLTSRREPPAPFGLSGGEAGAVGKNILIRKDENLEILPATASLELQPGDRIRIETPGGGAVSHESPSMPK